MLDPVVNLLGVILLRLQYAVLLIFPGSFLDKQV